MALDPGTRLGSFEVLGPLGAGGMGEVYRAADTILKREVALKILPEAFAADPMRLARFEREARLLASLNHPGLAAIYGLEQSGPIRYIVMELVPGETLAEKLARGPLPVLESLEIARRIAEALEAAHETGVIHRDLKPANIKVTPQGIVKVLDLGLAKAMDPKSDPSDASNSPTLMQDQTRPGMILGTAEFMSPEQARGKPLDKRTDIWSFGCILFEMLAGRRPFSGDTISDVIASILASEPDWSVLPDSTPARVRDLLRRCLEKDARNRLRDAGDARMELGQSLTESGPGAAHPNLPRPLRRNRTAISALAAAAVLVLAGTVWLVIQQRDASKSAPVTGSLVILPARDLSGAPGGQLIGDGFVEILSNRLGELPGVRVVTPSASVAASDAQSDPLRAARSVGAKLAVRSSFMRNGGTIRLFYSVWDVGKREQVASGKIDGLASDLFGLQDRLAERVASDLRLEPVSPGARRPSPSPGLEPGAQQERYLEALGNLQRYDRASSVDEALRILDALASDAPRSALVQAARGRADLAKYSLTKDRMWADRAIAASETARGLDPHLVEVDLTLGETLLLLGQQNRAEAAFRRALAARPGYAEAMVGLGRAREAAGDSAGAERAYRGAIDLQPFLFAPYNSLGGLYFDTGRYVDAAGIYRRLTLLTPDSGAAFSNLGGALTMSCDFDSAADAYRRALEIHPDEPAAASNLGMNLLWRGRYADAVPPLEHAARAAPNDYQVWANLGDAYQASNAPSEKRVAAFSRSISLALEQLRLNPRDSAAHSFLATSYAKIGRPKDAEEQLREALALDDKNPNVLMDAAVVSALMGRSTEAVEWIAKAVRSGYCAGIVAKQPEFAGLRDNPEFQAIVSAPRKAAGS